jgi:hypothetical protein
VEKTTNKPKGSMTDQEKMEVLEALRHGKQLQRALNVQFWEGSGFTTKLQWCDVEERDVLSALKQSVPVPAGPGATGHPARPVRVRPVARKCRVIWGADGQPRIIKEGESEYRNGAEVTENVNTFLEVETETSKD